jgi:hypothetical protein
MSGRDRVTWLGVLAAAGATLGGMGPAFAGGMGESADIQTQWWRVAGALVLCVALAIAAAFALKLQQGGQLKASGVRFRPADLAAALKRLAQPTPKLRLIETLRLSHQVDVCLIHYDDTEFAIAAGPQGGTLLFMRPKPVARPAVEAAPEAIAR